MKEAEEKACPTRKEVGFALVSAGVLTSEWLNAYALVPRRAFLPDDIWPFDMKTGQVVHVSRADDERRWQEYADADLPVVTQWDDGEHEGRRPGRLPTSSASMPSLVFQMLDLLTVDEGSKVLEIGTGTGWNAALLAHRAGEENVVSVEVDRSVADQAKRALDRFGALVEVVHGDGSRGAPDRAPYDRTLATCGVREIPFDWVAQTRPLGVIVAPWGTCFTHDDALVRLQVQPNAQGRHLGVHPVATLLALQRGRWPHPVDRTPIPAAAEVRQGGVQTAPLLVYGSETHSAPPTWWRRPPIVSAGPDTAVGGRCWAGRRGAECSGFTIPDRHPARISRGQEGDVWSLTTLQRVSPRYGAKGQSADLERGKSQVTALVRASGHHSLDARWRPIKSGARAPAQGAGRPSPPATRSTCWQPSPHRAAVPCRARRP
ncbi:methyltransferase domain-containing protein [Streptomyces halstedii]|uniref:Protein-L-isoaspartate O-methyltransferase n=1 Tax=Streptomyces halstedii TaxID=1944 RepID=A0ABS6TM77_STRHA|nr:methyltransferase domain-containing protein [Streptomyces halstedii]